jgi:hypothetical protein
VNKGLYRAPRDMRSLFSPEAAPTTFDYIPAPAGKSFTFIYISGKRSRKTAKIYITAKNKCEIRLPTSTQREHVFKIKVKKIVLKGNDRMEIWGNAFAFNVMAVIDYNGFRIEKPGTGKLFKVGKKTFEYSFPPGCGRHIFAGVSTNICGELTPPGVTRLLDNWKESLKNSPRT